jgi:hypothetical protein
MRHQAKKPTKMNRDLTPDPRDAGPFAVVAQLRQLNRRHNAARAQVRNWFDD